ncbi:MAG: hypothetical protein EBU85_00955 [Actinobacteria bacterium]|nr:hypothetical protein [Actinomycetota bacterium]
MSARNVQRSVLLACLGTLTGATSVLAATGKIHLTAQQDSASSSTLDQALGSLGTTGDRTPSSPTPNPGASESTGSTPQPSSSRTTSVTKPTPTKPHGASGTFTGGSVNDGWATFKVQLTVSAGKIIDSQVIELSPYGEGSRISLVNSYLREEVLTTKSVNCSTVGGATYSCAAYADSLAAAIARAGI